MNTVEQRYKNAGLLYFLFFCPSTLMKGHKNFGI
jgi:hypothetical protein